MIVPEVPFLMPSWYMPSIKYLQAMAHPNFKGWCIDVPFRSKSVQQRCYILGHKQLLRLSVSVNHHPQGKLNTARVDYTQSWHKDHLGALKACYGKAPFFEFLFPMLREVLESKQELLVDLHRASIEPVLKLLRLNTPVVYPYNVIQEQNWQLWQPGEGFKMTGKSIEHDKIADFSDGSEFVNLLSIYHLIFYKGRDSLNFIQAGSVIH
jgi:hypothetical protein